MTSVPIMAYPMHRKDAVLSRQATQLRCPTEVQSIEKENEDNQPRKYARRPKPIRISDRWPVLHKLMRARVSTAVRPSAPVPELDDDEDEENAARTPIYSFRMRQLLASQPTYPKFPSPLSGFPSLKRRIQPARHNYSHRGYSQGAINAQRELWMKRKFEWDEYEQLLWQYGMHLEEAYGGMVDCSDLVMNSSKPHPPFVLDEMKKLARKSERVLKSEHEGTSMPSRRPNPATFPRLGDLASIRDPFLTSVDIWFCDFPLWTLSKFIWNYDLNYRFQSEKNQYSGSCDAGKACCDSENFSVSANISMDSTTTTSSATSDATLIEANVGHTSKEVGNPAERYCEEKVIEDSSSSETICAPEDKRGKGWETNWFIRWEVLYHQVSLATNIASAISEPTLPKHSGKDATRIILTSSQVLYDPNADDDDLGDLPVPAADMLPEPEVEVVRMQRVSIPNVILPIDEEEEEDYGDVLPSSKYRLGAQMDPLSMFATAHPEYLDPDAEEDALCSSGEGLGTNREIGCNDLDKLAVSVDRLNVCI